MDMKILIAIVFKINEDSIITGHKAALVKPYCWLDKKNSIHLAENNKGLQ